MPAKIYNLDDYRPPAKKYRVDDIQLALALAIEALAPGVNFDSGDKRGGTPILTRGPATRARRGKND